MEKKLVNYSGFYSRPQSNLNAPTSLGSIGIGVRV